MRLRDAFKWAFTKCVRLCGALVVVGAIAIAEPRIRFESLNPVVDEAKRIASVELALSVPAHVQVIADPDKRTVRFVAQDGSLVPLDPILLSLGHITTAIGTGPSEILTAIRFLPGPIEVSVEASTTPVSEVASGRRLTIRGQILPPFFAERASRSLAHFVLSNLPTSTWGDMLRASGLLVDIFAGSSIATRSFSDEALIAQLTDEVIMLRQENELLRLQVVTRQPDQITVGKAEKLKPRSGRPDER